MTSGRTPDPPTLLDGVLDIVADAMTLKDWDTDERELIEDCLAANKEGRTGDVRVGLETLLWHDEAVENPAHGRQWTASRSAAHELDMANPA